jgi:hypothetical protein
MRLRHRILRNRGLMRKPGSVRNKFQRTAQRIRLTFLGKTAGHFSLYKESALASPEHPLPEAYVSHL